MTTGDGSAVPIATRLPFLSSGVDAAEQSSWRLPAATVRTAWRVVLASSGMVAFFTDGAVFIFALLGVGLSIAILVAIRDWWNAPTVRAIERMEATLAPASSPAFVSCPQCETRYRVERVDCPNCGLARSVSGVVQKR
jgi:hypothetical protein